MARVKEEIYKEAVKIWKKENPDKKYLDISQNTVVEIEGMGLIKIGQKIAYLRAIYKAMQEGKYYRTLRDLTEEQIEYWAKEGMIWDYVEYRKENSKSKNKGTLKKYI